jgi:hypothetical protein
MKIIALPAIAMLSIFGTACLQSKQPQVGKYTRTQTNGQQAQYDHPRESVDLGENEFVIEQETEVQEPDDTLSQADILMLDTVTIRGNGGLRENSPNFANRYTDPNGKPLNNAANTLVLKVGQVLNVCNDDAASAGLAIHTNGTPFPHGRNIRAGSCAEHRVRRTFNANGTNIYDHNLGGSFASRAYPIYIKVVSESEAESIIARDDN